LLVFQDIFVFQDEEADYLFMIEPGIFKDGSPSDSRESDLSEDLKTKLEFPTMI
jgi:hypothetical protein